MAGCVLRPRRDRTAVKKPSSEDFIYYSCMSDRTIFSSRMTNASKEDSVKLPGTWKAASQRDGARKFTASQPATSVKATPCASRPCAARFFLRSDWLAFTHSADVCLHTLVLTGIWLVIPTNFVSSLRSVALKWTRGSVHVLNCMNTGRCLECNIFFNSPQALGGHKTNSNDHKRRVDSVQQGDSSMLPIMPRLSSEVLSFEDIDVSAEFSPKRAKKKPMAQLDCFYDLVKGFPDDIRKAVASKKNPAAFFASWCASGRPYLCVTIGVFVFCCVSVHIQL